tara:strand:+ start:6375 stop:7475 length:1101 start_codon:yes stop_codon:yes gene_type:complete
MIHFRTRTAKSAQSPGTKRLSIAMGRKQIPPDIKRRPLMKYAVLSYIEGRNTYNLGDHVQSIAASRFLPRVDFHLNREELAYYDGPPVKLIMNGWFVHNSADWVPAPAITPLFVSFHINELAKKDFSSPQSIAYLKRHEPIGCRDLGTVNFLRSHGVDAYFSGCLTLTLDWLREPESVERDGVYEVDLFYRYPHLPTYLRDWRLFLRSIQHGWLFKTGKRQWHRSRLLSHIFRRCSRQRTQEPWNDGLDNPSKMLKARRLLKEYATAELVVTSRIHCALPCLALGTPVIFVDTFAGDPVSNCRFGGMLELFNVVRFDSKTGRFSANFEMNKKITPYLSPRNPDTYKRLVPPLIERCERFITDGNPG